MGKVVDDQILKQVREAFGKLNEPVELLYFGADQDCEYCDETRQLLEEVAAAHDKIGLSIYDVQADKELARKFNVTRAPCLVIAAKNDSEVMDFGIQYSGIPSGHEFNTLINDILLVSGRDSGLSQQTRGFLKDLDTPLLLQVFVTPSCPYCPRAVLLAHQMAMENPKMIRAEGVEATEFPELAAKFHVSGVPQTVINSGSRMVVGAVHEQNLLAQIMGALQN
jgi:glutaredoxin-like protein